MHWPSSCLCNGFGKQLSNSCLYLMRLERLTHLYPRSKIHKKRNKPISQGQFCQEYQCSPSNDIGSKSKKQQFQHAKCINTCLQRFCESTVNVTQSFQNRSFGVSQVTSSTCWVGKAYQSGGEKINHWTKFQDLNGKWVKKKSQGQSFRYDGEQWHLEHANLIVLLRIQGRDLMLKMLEI